MNEILILGIIVALLLKLVSLRKAKSAAMANALCHGCVHVHKVKGSSKQLLFCSFGSELRPIKFAVRECTGFRSDSAPVSHSGAGRGIRASGRAERRRGFSGDGDSHQPLTANTRPANLPAGFVLLLSVLECSHYRGPSTPLRMTGSAGGRALSNPLHFKAGYSSNLRI